MAGVRHKDPSLVKHKRRDRDKRLMIPLPSGERNGIPPMPILPARIQEWPMTVINTWEKFWNSDLSLAVDYNADYQRLTRWCECMAEQSMLLRRIRKEGYVVAGTRGTLVAHPALQYVQHLDRELDKIAEHFGMTPLSRFRLQVTFSQAGQQKEKLEEAQEKSQQRRRTQDTGPRSLQEVA